MFTRESFRALPTIPLPAVLLMLLALAGPLQAKTALQHLREAPAPHFRKSDLLLPLSRWGWTMPYDVRVELCERWGYALEFGGYATPEYVAQLDDPASVPARLAALTAADPEKYPLAVLTHRGIPEELPAETWTRDAQGNLPEGQNIWSPEAPDEVFAQMGEIGAAPLRKIRAKAPIAVVLNGGEYATSVYGHHGKYWENDPRIIQARGQTRWFDYVSHRKAHQEFFIAQAIREATPDRRTYIFYATGQTHRRRYGHWWTWAWDYGAMRNISDLPSSSLYYREFNTGWTGDTDLLTQSLNAIAEAHAYGEPFSYNWVCAGWTRANMGEAAYGDLERYAGYLKCLYTAGQIGAVAGYFANDGFEGEVGDTPRHWLRQMMVLGHVHALFSHLDEFLRDGYLLQGPNRHRWSTDLPAYELPTGDADLRVLGRKHKARAEWLLTAWAAGGEARDAAVEVPGLGKVTLHARPAGSVYRARLENSQPVLELVDQDAMLPTEHLRAE